MTKAKFKPEAADRYRLRMVFGEWSGARFRSGYGSGDRISGKQAEHCGHPQEGNMEPNDD